MKILIIGDLCLLTDSLSLLLRSQPDPVVSVVTGDILEFRNRHPGYVPDIILLMVSSPDRAERRDRTELELFKQTYPASGLVVCSDQPLPTVKNYLKKGARGYLSQKATLDELLACLKAVQNGLRYVEPDVLDQLLGESRQEKPKIVGALVSSLSSIEYKVAQLAIEGKNGKVIAEAINRKPSSVSGIKARIFHKLNVPSMAVLRRLVQKES